MEPFLRLIAFTHRSGSKVVLLFFLLCFACGSDSTDNSATDFSEVAATDEIAEYMQRFEGRGQMVDASRLPSGEDVLSQFKVASDLQIDLVLAEPLVSQPVELNFDHRGRLWVVQYGQYPYPKGLKVTGIDHHIRMTFDRKPEPPPKGAKGADKITYYEDTDGDGVYDQAVDAITGLNIATAVTWGRNKIWVLNPPYLLAYPDPDGDGIPNGDPQVCVDGFGLEDTHAVANSLRWGPDGWLYGATGSTVHSHIKTATQDDIYFEGQSIWRYHPEYERFEIFAEGGGNTFHVEIDAKGRIYSGTNGTSRGQYYKQGAYYKKNWGKHGALTNDYAFGHLPDMHFEGEKIRFTHAWIKYEGGYLPARFAEKIVAINPLHNFLITSSLETTGSTFATEDQEKILTSENRWFRPVDIKVGPDGAIYLADWADSRLSHVNPSDDWHKSSGRIYRIRSRDPLPPSLGDLSKSSDAKLVELLHHKNKWYRQQAQRQFGDRRSPGAVNILQPLLMANNGQLALEAFWAIYQSGGWSDEIAMAGLHHVDPYVRMWAVRLIGDEAKASVPLVNALLDRCSSEEHPEVLNQITATARRLPAAVGLKMVEVIAPKIDLEDPDNPLMFWWAMEANLAGQYSAVLELFQNSTFWRIPVIYEIVIERLMQRTIMEGNVEDLSFATDLFKLAPDQEIGQKLMEGFIKGAIGVDRNDLPAELFKAMEPFDQNRRANELAAKILEQDSEAIAKALNALADEELPVAQRQALVRVFGQHPFAGAVSTLLDIVERTSTSKALIVETLQTLATYTDTLIGVRIAANFPDHLRADPSTRRASLQMLLTRRSWSDQLWKEITMNRTVHASDLTRDLVRQLYWMSDENRRAEIVNVWPWYRSEKASKKDSLLDNIGSLIEKVPCNLKTGKQLFTALCGSCHKLFGQGGDLGPDLTGYDRRDANYLALHIVDPNIEIREGYTNFGIRTQDQRYYMGILRERSGKQITMETESGIRHTFNVEKIESLEPQEESLMPEGLLNGLPEAQICDLFSYLMSQ